MLPTTNENKPYISLIALIFLGTEVSLNIIQSIASLPFVQEVQIKCYHISICRDQILQACIVKKMDLFYLEMLPNLLHKLQ